LLADAGYPGGRGFPAFTILVFGTPVSHAHFPLLCSHWSSVLGIQVRTEFVTSEGFVARMRSDPPLMARTAWLADFPDPDNFLRLGLGYYGDVNWNPEYAQLVEEARCATDPRHRMALYARADRILIEQAAIIPLVYGRIDLLVKPWVRSFPLSPVCTWFWKDVVIDPE
jgi:oligopeptide transport system substrate-binding protein